MADATASATLVDQWDDGQRNHAIVEITIAAGDYVASGLTVAGMSGSIGILTTNVPIFMSNAGNGGCAVYSVDKTSGKLRLYVPKAAGAVSYLIEHPVAAIDATIIAERPRFHIITTKY